jgi:formylglycine-generating enzyme required for sulfatase activity
LKNILTLVIACSVFACSDDDRPGPCVGCVEQTGGFGGAGGTGATAGSAGAGGSALASSGGAPQCQGVKGAPMVFLDDGLGNGTGYCIDVREVSVAEFNTFKQLVGDTPKQQAPCSANLGWQNIGESSQLPMRYVDWCDATAFCAWAGKRLCGRIGGGANTTSTEASDPTLDEWFRACTNAGTSVYPYGDAFNGNICNTHTPGNNVDDVGSNVGCHGTGDPFDKLFDMSGNVGEWTAYCDPDSGGAVPDEDEYCYLRGGDFTTVVPETSGRCDYTEKKQRLEAPTITMGIRCCKDADLDVDGG